MIPLGPGGRVFLGFYDNRNFYLSCNRFVKTKTIPWAFVWNFMFLGCKDYYQKCPISWLLLGFFLILVGGFKDHF